MTSFENKYEIIGDPIGRGHFATVFKCICKDDNKFYAAKRIKHARNKLSKIGAQPEDITREIYALQSFENSFVIQLHDVFRDCQLMGNNGRIIATETILVLELVEGGEFFKKICEEDVLCEVDAVSYLTQILYALDHIHSKNIVHLDIKPENIMFNLNGDKIKIIDFGMARNLEKDSNVDFRIAGTIPYLSPERVNADPISTAADMWSLGIITCILLTGFNPFECSDHELTLKEKEQQTTAKITSGDLDLSLEFFNSTSNNAKDFIKKLLCKNPLERMTAKESLQHAWIMENSKSSDKRRNSQLNVTNLRNFMAKDRWKSAIFSIKECFVLSKRFSLPSRLPNYRKEHADKNEQNITKGPLFSTIKNGNLDDLRTLLTNSPNLDINKKNIHGESIMHIVCSASNIDVLDFLKTKGVQLDIRDENGNDIAFWAARQGRTDILEYLHENKISLTNTNNSGENSLHVSTRYGHYGVVEMLLKADCDTNVKDKLGETPLHIASWHSMSYICQKLISAGAEVDIQNVTNMETPLHIAINRGNLDCVDVLLRAGANPSLPNKNTESPLHLACRKQFEDICVSLLQHPKCNIDAVNRLNETPLFVAIEENLLSIVQTLCAFGCRIDVYNNSGHTVLHVATNLGRLEIIRCLLLSGCDPLEKTKDSRQLTSFELAMKNNQTDFINLYEQTKTQECRTLLAKQLMPRNETLNRIKVKIFGNSAVGKTTLIETLKRGYLSGIFRLSKSTTTPTNGIEIHQSNINTSGELSFWEFSGHEKYFTIYDHFIGDFNCIQLILFKLTDPVAVYTKEILFWLEFIKARVPILQPICSDGCQMYRGHIALIATHNDQCTTPKIVLEKIMSNLLSTVNRLYSTDFLIHPNIFIIDSQVPTAPCYKELRNYLSYEKALIVGFLAKPNSLFYLCLSILSSWRKERLSFPVITWKEFLHLVRSKINNLANENHVQRVLEQLQLIGEIVYVDGSYDDEDYIVLQPRWLCNYIFGKLLSFEIPFIVNNPNGIYKVSDCSTKWALKSDSIKLFKLLEVFGFCASIKDDKLDIVQYEFPCLITIEARLDEVWSKTDFFNIHGGLRLIPSGVQLSHIFPRLQVSLRRFCNKNVTYTRLKLLQWHDCSKIIDDDIEMLILVNNNYIDIRLRAIECDDNNKNNGCNFFKFLDNISDLIEKGIKSSCPGCHCSRNAISPLSLSKYVWEPKIYTSEEILKAQMKDEQHLKFDVDFQENYSCVITLCSKIALMPGIQLPVIDLPSITHRKLAQLLDPIDKQGRDWCLLAVELGLEDTVPDIDKTHGKLQTSKTIRLLYEWSRSEPISSNVGKLCNILSKFGRDDVVNLLLQMTPIYNVIDTANFIYNS